jgi:hypothetical protein
MNQPPLSALIAEQSRRLTQVAHQLAHEGHTRVAACLAIHTAELTCHENAARRLEQELATAQAQLNGSRAALAQARATARHLTAELLEEQDLQQAAEPPPKACHPTLQAIRRHHAHSQTIAALKASLPRLME